MRHRRVSLLLFLFASSLAAQPVVPVAREPRHHFRVANDTLRIYDVVVPPGDTTFYHLHAVDYVYVTFGEASLVAQVLGSEPAPLVLHDGEVRFSRGPLTHRVSNPSPTPFHNLTIELPGHGAANAVVMPSLQRGDSVVMDNERVRAIRHLIAPGATATLPEQARVLDVYVTAGRIEDELDGSAGIPRTVRPATFRWRGSAREYRVHNLGAATVVLLTIGIK